MLMNVGLIPTTTSIADIGCDHGWVSIHLIEEKKASHVIAMDIAEGPLNSASNHVKETNHGNDIEVRLSDGAKGLALNDGVLEVNGILMAGIGGRLALRIIEDSLDKYKAADFTVLQVQSDLEYVRERLIQLGFRIVDEDIVCEDGKYYPAMRIIFDPDYKCELTEAEAKYGPVLISKKHGCLTDMLQYKKSQYEAIASGIDVDGNEKNKARKADIIHEIELIDLILG